jgi:hypothetical protein
MKKVRYAVGAIGLTPVIGLLAPNTATAATHSPKTGKKMVVQTGVRPDTGNDNPLYISGNPEAFFMSVCGTNQYGTYFCTEDKYLNTNSWVAHYSKYIWTGNFKIIYYSSAGVNISGFCSASVGKIGYYPDSLKNANGVRFKRTYAGENDKDNVC